MQAEQANVEVAAINNEASDRYFHKAKNLEKY